MSLLLPPLLRSVHRAWVVLLGLLAVTLPAAAQTFKLLHSFDRGLEGSFYDSPLILGTDGRLYGSTSRGGHYDHGTVFAMAVDGTGFTVLKHFSGTNADGNGPTGGLLQGQDGRLYGTTFQSISGSQYGTIFSLNPDGSDFRVIRLLTSIAEGVGLLGGLVQDAAGRLYGVASNGGIGANIGTVYSLRPDGSDFKVHQHFSNALGSAPRGRLCFGPDGRLYGTTSAGGTNGDGTIFALDPAATPGTGLTVLHHLVAATDGSTPHAGLLYGSDGRFYGVNREGGANNTGTLFALSVTSGGDVTYSVLQTFVNAGPTSTGIRPSGHLIQGLDGRLYGTTHFQSNSRVFAFDPVTNQFTNVRVLTVDEGQNLTAGVIQAPSGRLFGTAAGFGAFNHGSIFSLDPSGANFAVLRQGEPNSRGHQPRAAVVAGPDGRLYGTTYSGGKAATAGAIFRLNRDGSNFAIAWGRDSGSLTQPGAFQAGMTLFADGNFYGTADAGSGNSGSLYVYQPGSSTASVLHGFGLVQNGRLPSGEVWNGGDGWLYGLTAESGPGNGGTFFALNLNPAFPFTQPYLETRYAFQASGTTGAKPLGRILRGSDGRFYGTASTSGPNAGGTLFALNADGIGFTVLHAFGATDDGRTPETGVVQAPNGRLFGTTRTGPNSRGTLYSIKPDGTGYQKHREFAISESTLSELVVGPDGRIYGGLTGAGAATLFSVDATGSDYAVARTLSALEGQGQISLAVLSDGLIYGAASTGGEYGGGTLFSLSVLPPPVIVSPLTAQGTYGQPFSYAIAATNAPSDFDALNLPAALGVDHATGVISGTPQAAGFFPVDIAAANAGGTALATLSLTIAKANAAIAFSDLSRVYDGAPKPATIATTPAGLSLLTTYDGSLSLPVNAGSYAVATAVVDPNYEGSGTATLTITPAPATVTLAQTTQTFDGQPKPVSVTTSPPSLPVTVTYDGSPVVPSAVGSYAVVATIASPNHTGSGTGTLTIQPVSAPVPDNITSSVTWTQGGFRLNRATGRYVQSVTLHNPQATRTGPVSFVLDGLPAGVTLVTRSGTTGQTSPVGSPYLDLALGDNVLDHLETVAFNLEFANPTNQPIAYQVRVLAGVGGR